MSLDLLASRMVHAARLLERAVHDPGPWTLVWGPHTVVAERQTHPDGVTFTGQVPGCCYLRSPDGQVTLCCRGQELACRTVEHPGDGEFTLVWAITARQYAGDLHLAA